MSAAAEQTTRLGPFTARVVGSEPLGGRGASDEHGVEGRR